MEVEPAILVEELWKSGEDLEPHLRAEEFRKALLVIEMAVDPLEVQLDAFSHSNGFETIEKAGKFPQYGEES